MPTVAQMYATMEEDKAVRLLPEFFDGDIYEVADDAKREGALYVGRVCANIDEFKTCMRNVTMAVECVYSGRSTELFVRIRALTESGQHYKNYGEYQLSYL